MRRPARVLLAALLGAGALAAPAPAAPPTPITESPTTNPPPEFEGAPATAQPLSFEEAPAPPRHPFMAPNDRSNIHDDAYQTDTVDGPGPLGREMERLSTQQFADCASVTFDQRGRIVTICVGIDRPTLKLFDPRTLEQLASMPLPPRNPGTGSIFNDFAGGGYFYLDHLDRAVVPTTSRHLLVIGQTPAPGFAVERDHDLSGVVPSDDKLFATMPDWSGRLWVVTQNGRLVTIDPASGAVRVRALGEQITNSFAADETGAIYVVTDRALYRLRAGADGTPEVVWREVYRNSGIAKPGQVNAGSGTTPTLMGSKYVAITDNADPMNVVVYHRAAEVGDRRLVCEQPIFSAGASATDNSLIGTARSMVVENNYGYTGPAATVGGSTAPGVERIDISPDDRGCRTVWRSTERSPTVVPKLSLHNGLVYVYTKEPDPDRRDPFYLTALDFRTGRTVFKRLAGRGLGFNNNYAPVSLGPDGTAYVGTLGGLVALRDRVAPPRVPRAQTQPQAGIAPSAGLGRPRLALGLRGLRLPHGARRGTPGCARYNFSTALAGPDRTLIRRTDWFFATRTRPVVRVHSPLSPLRILRRGLVYGRYYRLRALTTLADGRQASLVRYFRAC